MFNFSDYDIRPVTWTDKQTLLGWRNLESVRKFMYTDHMISVDEHEVWFAKMMASSTEQYHIFLYKDQPIGTISFSQINLQHQRCSWAFYLGERNVPRGCGSVMEYLAIEFAFSNIGITKLYCEVLSLNSTVISLHNKFGFSREGCLRRHYLKGAHFEDVIVLSLLSDEWQGLKTKQRERIFGSGVI